MTEPSNPPPDLDAAENEAASQAVEQPKADGETAGEADQPDESAEHGDEAQQDDDQEGQTSDINGNQNMNYQNMGGGDVNQMQMMMAMQNGMGFNPMMGKLNVHTSIFTTFPLTDTHRDEHGPDDYAKYVYER